jgi:hypothetical protein
MTDPDSTSLEQPEGSGHRGIRLMLAVILVIVVGTLRIIGSNANKRVFDGCQLDSVAVPESSRDGEIQTQRLLRLGRPASATSPDCDFNVAAQKACYWSDLLGA